jgi:hypothetical protein
MSTETVPTADTGGLNEQVEAVVRETKALMAAQAAGRRARLLLLVVFVVFVAVVTYAFFDLGNKLLGQENLDALAKAGQERLVKNQGEYMKELQKLIETSSPVLTTAFMTQAKQDLPKYMQGLEKQRDELRSSLEAKLSKKLDGLYAETLDRHDKIMKEEFPKYNDDALQARMRENINMALEKLVKKYYVDEMNRQMDVLYTTWDNFPAAEPPKAGGVSTEDQLVVELTDWLKYIMSHSPSIGTP